MNGCAGMSTPVCNRRPAARNVNNNQVVTINGVIRAAAVSLIAVPQLSAVTVSPAKGHPRTTTTTPGVNCKKKSYFHDVLIHYDEDSDQLLVDFPEG